MNKNIINVFGRWIDISRIISITEPKLEDGYSYEICASFHIYAEMLDKPMYIKQFLFKENDIWTKSPASMFVGTYIASQCPELIQDTVKSSSSVEILDYVINKIGDTEKVLRNLKSLQKFWQDYELLLQKWKECKQ